MLSGMSEIRKTVCSRDCPDACAIEAVVENGQVVRLRGDKSHPVTRGFLCYRTTLFPTLQNSPERLRTPLLRRGDGFEPISWEAALDLAAAKLTKIRDESGPAAIFHYRSGGSLGALKSLCDYFFEQFGPVTTKRGDICSGAGDAAQMLDFGEEDSHDVFDLLESRHILLWGKNVSVSSPHLVPILKDAAKRGARLVQIDPAWQKTSTLVEKYLQPRPGGDFALAMAVAQVLFVNGWVDASAASYCDGLNEFQALAQSKTLAAWCDEADVTMDDARDLAWRLGSDGPTAILVGWGFPRRANGAATVRALDALCAISGNIGRVGGGVSFYYKRRGAFDMSFLQKTPPRTICEPEFGPQVLAATDPPIRAVWVTAGNPVAMLPQSDTTAEALRTREFVVVVDPFLTDTARLAHLVLPTTTLLEDDDVLGAYGHHWIGVSQPAVAPPAGVLTDLEIMVELAKRVGLADRMRPAGANGESLARAWKRRIVEPLLAPHGITLERLEQGPVRSPLAPKVLFADRKFKTKSGRVNLITEMVEAPRVSNEYPLFLMAMSTEKSQSSTWSVPEDEHAVVTVHPAAAPGIADGALAKLESAIGSLVVRVRHDKRQRRDVALTAKGGSWHGGRCMNALVRARVTDAGEGGALYDEGVRLVPLS
jgi:anaerobic selenocysteine-containing dehydrogenase